MACDRHLDNPTVGLVLDIVGAVLVALEVLRRVAPTEGEIRLAMDPASAIIGGPGEEAVRRAYGNGLCEHAADRRWVQIGLGCLMVGFFLQGVGTWWPVWFK